MISVDCVISHEKRRIDVQRNIILAGAFLPILHDGFYTRVIAHHRRLFKRLHRSCKEKPLNFNRTMRNWRARANPTRLFETRAIKGT